MTREEAIEQIKDEIKNYVGFIKNIENITITVDKHQLYVNFMVYVFKARMFDIVVFNDKSIILEPSSYCIIMRKKNLSVLYSMWEEIENILDKVEE